MGTLKDSIDDLIGGVAGDTTSLATLSNEVSADLTTDSTALSALANEVSVDLANDITIIATLVNEMAADWPFFINSIEELRGDFNLEATAQADWGNTITNSPSATISSPIINVSPRTASVVTPAARAASVVTPTAVSNTTGTLGTTTPTL
jgi:hypothetical protein